MMPPIAVLLSMMCLVAAQKPGQDDSVPKEVSEFLNGELKKKWYIGSKDLSLYFPNVPKSDLVAAYDKLAQKFKELPRQEDHSGLVYAVAASPFGIIASGSDDKTIGLWRRNDEEASLRRIASLSSGSKINSLAIDPRGQLLAAALSSGWIQIYNLTTGLSVGALEGQKTSEVWSLAWSRSGENLISGGLDRAVRIWDVKTKQVNYALRGHDEWINGVAVSPDGSFIVSGSGDKTVRVWDTRTMKCRYTLKGHTDFVRSVAVMEDATTIVSGSDDAHVRLWDANTGKAIGVLQGHLKGIYSVSAGPGKLFVSGSRDNTVKVWDVREPEPLKDFTHLQWDVNSVTWLGSHFVVSGSDDKTVKLFKIPQYS